MKNKLNIDLIVCSSGGVIPQKYWNCYPYLTYDAHRDEDLLYCEKLFNRTVKKWNDDGQISKSRFKRSKV